MEIISLKIFAESGKFGSIGIGTSKSEVIRKLGDDFNFHDGGETQIIKYGWYEFFFWSNTEKLFGIQNDHLQSDCTNHDEMINFENQKFKIDKWFLRTGKDFTFNEVSLIMDSENIEFLIQEAYKNGPEVIKFKSGVYFDFSEGTSGWDADKGEWFETTIENQKDYLLNGIRLFDLSKN